MLSGLLSLLILALDVWAIINILQSSESTVNKVVWTILVILLPVVGLVIWWFVGPKPANA